MANRPLRAQRRLTLLYQLFLTSTEARRFMRAALGGTDMSGEEYGIYSYFYANGPRTLSDAASQLGYPVTTLASLLAPGFDAGELARRPHPRDGRARLIELTDRGKARMDAVIPVFRAAYGALLSELDGDGADAEALFDALGTLREAIAATATQLEDEAMQLETGSE